MLESDYFLEQKAYLEDWSNRYNNLSFIEDDPISIPHLFTKKQDIEISGFFAAILAWGRREVIIRNAKKLLERMDFAPHDFMLNHEEQDLKIFLNFVHRTFNATDLLFLIHFLSRHYKHSESLESAFTKNLKKEDRNIEPGLIGFHDYCFSFEEAPERTKKHIATPLRKSACKRLNMFLRWMVRKDNKGVDFGIWGNIMTSQLVCPLDVHSSTIARELGFLKRKQNDWAAAVELTEKLKEFNKIDPVIYDFALFGIGVNRNST